MAGAVFNSILCRLCSLVNKVVDDDDVVEEGEVAVATAEDNMVVFLSSVSFSNKCLETMRSIVPLR